jgi:hypothetical protein
MSLMYLVGSQQVGIRRFALFVLDNSLFILQAVLAVGVPTFFV